jgi:hypothetical protein
MKPLILASDPAMHFLTELVLSAQQTRPTSLNNHNVYTSVLRALEQRQSPLGLLRLWDALRAAAAGLTLRLVKHNNARRK